VTLKISLHSTAALYYIMQLTLCHMDDLCARITRNIINKEHG